MQKSNYLLISLFIGSMLLRIALAWQSIPRLVMFPLVDDTFYSLKIARNIALGKGITYDGVHPTNGFQPLYVFLSASIYYICNGHKILPIHLILTLVSFLSACTVLLVYAITEYIATEKAGLFAAFLWALSPVVWEFEMCGLETSLYIFLMAVSIYYYLSRIRCQGSAGIMRSINMGVLLGLSILARIDAGFLVVALLIDLIWVKWKNIFSGNKLKLFKLFIVFLLSMGIFLGPWFAYNFLTFGSLMPVSGRAVHFICWLQDAHKFGVSRETIPALYYLQNAVLSFHKLFRSPLPHAIFWAGAFLKNSFWGYIFLSGMFLLYVILLFLKSSRVKKYLLRIRLKEILFVIPWSIIFISAYIFYVFGQYYYMRYYMPIIFITILLSGVSYDLGIVLLKSRRIRRYVQTSLVIFLMSVSLYQFYDRYVCASYPTNSVDYGIVLWANKNLPAGTTIGAFQSGLIGYFTDCRVVNLDGVVNQEAYEAIRKNRLLDYIERAGIKYILDRTGLINEFIFDTRTDSIPDTHRLKLIMKDINGAALYSVAANLNPLTKSL